ncbi:hypothetical protein U6N30_06725 [Blastococcus brunescens]|uniref:Uncharacterized protein n=1 Tax=Blastococcus brunescens TaxID=1564165 RepID=A0ABZ1B3F5_9ACTN|nr:hypothetical protein [Blastococcus sp. BMG 8361]WRL65336.1 hypothetical protein U6N30_06725 [Blastococcus sp. BMG 8361]
MLMLCETLPPSSPQHSTSTKKECPSIQPSVALSKRRSVAATRKLVTLPFWVRFRVGEVTTLPMTVISVAFTVLLWGCGAGRRDRRRADVHRAWCRPTAGWSPSCDLWTASRPVDAHPAA